MVSMINWRVIITGVWLFFCQNIWANSQADDPYDAQHALQKGLQACSKARTLTITDLGAAQYQWDLYLQYLREAESLNSRLINQPDKETLAKLTHCNKDVAHNLLRAKATTLMQEGFEFCKHANDSIEQQDSIGAQAYYGQYLALRDEAIGIQESTLEMPTIKQRATECTKLQPRIEALQNSQSQQVRQAEAAIGQFNQAMRYCQAANQMLSSNASIADKLNHGKKLVMQTADAKQTARTLALPALEATEIPLNAYREELQHLLDQVTLCEGQISASFREIQQQSLALKKQLTQVNESLSTALEFCNQGLVITTADKKAQMKLFQRSATVKKEALSNPDVFDLASQHPHWSESQTFVQLLKSSKICQEQLAAGIR